MDLLLARSAVVNAQLADGSTALRQPRGSRGRLQAWFLRAESAFSSVFGCVLRVQTCGRTRLALSDVFLHYNLILIRTIF